MSTRCNVRLFSLLTAAVLGACASNSETNNELVNEAQVADLLCAPTSPNGMIPSEGSPLVDIEIDSFGFFSMQIPASWVGLDGPEEIDLVLRPAQRNTSIEGGRAEDFDDIADGLAPGANQSSSLIFEEFQASGEIVSAAMPALADMRFIFAGLSEDGGTLVEENSGKTDTLARVSVTVLADDPERVEDQVLIPLDFGVCKVKSLQEARRCFTLDQFCGACVSDAECPSTGTCADGVCRPAG